VYVVNLVDALDHQSKGVSRDDALIEYDIAELHYGKFKAVRDVRETGKKYDYRFYRSVRMRHNAAAIAHATRTAMTLHPRHEHRL